MFDGEIWHGMGIIPMLQAACIEGAINPLHVVLLHSGGIQNRWSELDGTAPIANYLADDLLPWLRRQGIDSPPQDTLLCGQSLGGLAALLSVLDRPEHFGGALSQSASLWQPVVVDRLRELVDTGQGSRLGHLYLDIQVGAQEWVLEPLHQTVVKELSKATANFNFSIYNGGHDYACWRGGIIPALERVFGCLG